MHIGEISASLALYRQKPVEILQGLYASEKLIQDLVDIQNTF